MASASTNFHRCLDRVLSLVALLAVFLTTPAAVRGAESAPAPAPAPTPGFQSAVDRVLVRCTVILQTRPNRLYCYATNAPFRVILRTPEKFRHGEVFLAEGEMAREQLVEAIPTLLDATVTRTSEISLPPPIQLTPGAMASRNLNFHRVALRGRVVSHEWMKFLDHRVEVIVADGVDRRFVVHVLEFSNAANRLPPGTEVEFVGLSFLETLVEAHGPEAQMDVENLDECRILKSAPWMTPKRAHRLLIACLAVLTLGAVWAAHERRQIRRLRAAERAVRELNSELEQRIAARTAELQSANQRLRQAEQDLLRTIATEKELSQLKTRFVSMVSHELRNPLGVVMCSAEVLRNYPDELDAAERDRNIDSILDASRRMAALIEEVLFHGRLESGRMQCNRVPIALADLLRRTITEATVTASRPDAVRLDIRGTLDGSLGDESLIRHILSNLLSNALKFSPVTETVEVHVDRSGQDAVIRVLDRGIGIPEPDRNRIFDGFFRGSNVGPTGGSGIGLSIVRRCVELHAGAIRFIPREGGGTLFEVQLPLFTA